MSVNVVQIVTAGPQGPPGSAGSAWVSHPISMNLTDWVASGDGTWSETGGVISQTNPLATSANLVNSEQILGSDTFIIQADIRIPTGQDAGVSSAAGVNYGACLELPYTGNGVYVFSSGPGDTDPLRADISLGNSLAVPAPLHGEWHTYRVRSSTAISRFYYDSVFLYQQIHSGGSWGSTTATPPGNVFTSINQVVGLVDVRNITVWTLSSDL